MTTAPSRRGPALALAAAALFGLSTPFAKALLGDVSPWLLAGLLYLGAGVALGALLLIQRLFGTPQRREAQLSRPDLPWLAAIVGFGGVIGPLLLMTGLTTTSAASASLLLNLEGVFTLAIAWTIFRENVDLRIGIGAAAILGGALLLSWEGEGISAGWGPPAIAGACLAWAIDNNLTRKLSAADPIQLVTIKGLAAGAVNAGLALALGDPLPAATPALAAGVVGSFGYGASLVLFVLALRDLGTARTGAYFSSAPFVGAAVAVAAFGEPLSLQLVVAALLMAGGLYLHLAERHEHEHMHEPLVHEHRHVHDEHHQHEHPPGVDSRGPHSHAHVHRRLIHRHPHYPDLHHRHAH